MKRGFLNGSKAKARPLGPALASKRCPVLLDFPKVNGKDPRHTIHEMTYLRLPTDAQPEDPVTECFFYPGSKEFLASLPGFPQPLINPEPGPTFRKALAPGKGMGLFSACALTAGSLIFSERPVLLVAPTLVMCVALTTVSDFDEYSANEMEKHYAVAVNRMRPDDKAAFMALARGKKEPASRPINGIVDTNSFGVFGLRPGVVGDRERYHGVFLNLSRVNHSCSPNTTYRFDLPSFSYRLFAVRDIVEGEELTLQYTFVDCCKAERQDRLDLSYSFLCTCTSCLNSVDSDPRRTVIENFHVSVAKWALDLTLPDDQIIVECQKLLALTVSEGLESVGQHFEAMNAMMEVYICLGDAQSASEWAAQLEKRRWDDKCGDVKGLIDPASPAYQKHPLWRKRCGVSAEK